MRPESAERPARGTGPEIGPRSPDENRLGDQYAEMVPRVVELLGRRPAVAAAREMVLQIGHQMGAATADGSLQQAAEAPAGLVDGEFPMSLDAPVPQADTCGLQLDGSRLRGDPEERGRHLQALPLDLDVPQQTAGGLRQTMEGTVDQAPPCRDEQGAQSRPYRGATPSALGPLGGDALHGDEQAGTPCGPGPGPPQRVQEDPAEGERRRHTRALIRHRAQLGVVEDRLPVAGRQLLDVPVCRRPARRLLQLLRERLVRQLGPRAGTRGARLRHLVHGQPYCPPVEP